MIQKKKKKKEKRKEKKVQELPSSVSSTHPAIEISHHESITTFLFSTPRHELTLGGGVIPPLHTPSLRFFPFGFLHSGLMDFVCF